MLKNKIVLTAILAVLAALGVVAANYCGEPCTVVVQALTDAVNGAAVAE